MKNTIGNLIELLSQISKHYGNDIPVSINLYHDRILALQSICLDNADNDVQLFFEADLEDRAEQKKDFEVYSQSGHLEEILTYGRMIKPLSPEPFLDDIDKVYDLLTITKEEFLNSYSYIDEQSYDLTLTKILPINDSSKENEEQISNLADLTREAENLYLDEVNDRSTGWNVTGSELKEAIFNFVKMNLSKEQIDVYNDYCDSMGV